MDIDDDDRVGGEGKLKGASSSSSSAAAAAAAAVGSSSSAAGVHSMNQGTKLASLSQGRTR